MPTIPRLSLARRVILGCLFALAVVFIYGHVRGWTPEKVRRSIGDNLPPGSTRLEIEAHLKSVGWIPDFADDPTTLDSYGEYAGLRADQLGGVVIAEVPDANVGYLGVEHGAITVFLYLDRAGRLARRRLGLEDNS